jgi:hypothetical protein
MLRKLTYEPSITLKPGNSFKTDINSTVCHNIRIAGSKRALLLRAQDRRSRLDSGVKISSVSSNGLWHVSSTRYVNIIASTSDVIWAISDAIN